MEDENTNVGSKNEQEASLAWTGLQFYRRDPDDPKHIQQRSFPFWAPSVDFAMQHAKTTNAAAIHERTYWTHIHQFNKLTETLEGSTQTIEDKEYPIG
ncbi:MAG: hypothetical protein [Arizlama microvirus]|nr:MAG: hypothetical protein [Arizlama microvirus]